MRFNSSDAELRVDPAVLQEKADTARERIAVYRVAYEELEGVLNSLESCWQGATADKARQQYKRLTQTLDGDIRDLESYPEELMRQVGVYEYTVNKMKVIMETMSTFQMF
jgi:WXG100 family type VII secretion target